MASASIPHTNVGSGCTIITQVVPSSTSRATVEQNSPQTKTLLEAFLKSEPKALGTVQIMIGVITILFGIVITVYPCNFSACSGVVFWSSMFYISTGSLAVSGSNTLKTCVVKATLMMNILSMITAGIAMIILYLDLTLGNFTWKFLNPCNVYHGGTSTSSLSHITESRTNGITGVLLFFSALQFAISTGILIVTSKAICANGPIRSINNLVPNPESAVPVVSSFPAFQTQLGFSTMNAVNLSSLPVDSPPAYSELS